MDPISITTGSLAIIAYCVQVAQWIQNLKAVDERIQGFLEELYSLSATHDALNKTLQQPAMLAAARNAEQNAGGELWRQIGQSINDCRNTMAQLQWLLSDIDKNSNSLMRRPIKMFREQLVSGQIAVLRQRINLFNSTLALPLQMISVTQQIDQQELTNEQYSRLDSQISQLNRTTSRLAVALNNHIPALGAASLKSSTDEETLVYERLESCLETARKFCSNASAVSSVKSGASTITPYGVRASGSVAGTGSIAGERLTFERRNRIADWVPEAPESKHSDEDLLSGSPGSTVPTSWESLSNRHNNRGSFLELQDDDLEFEKTQKFLQMGQKKSESGDYAGAEKAFLKAIYELENHDLKDKIALDLAEVHLMLAKAYLKQKKLTEAEALLLPLTEGKDDCDVLQICSASYLLGELYLAKANAEDQHATVKEPSLDAAVKYSTMSYKGRRSRLGKTSKLCLEVAKLLVLVYSAKNDDAEVEFWQEEATHMTEGTSSAPLKQVDSKDRALPPVAEISSLNHDANPKQKQARSRFTLSRNKSSNSTPAIQQHAPNEPTSPLLTGASSIRSVEAMSESLFPNIPATAPGDPAPRRSTSWFSNTSKSKSPDLSRKMSSSKPFPIPLSIYPDSKLVTRQEAASVKFGEIKDLCARGDHKKAARVATTYLSGYVRSGEVLFEKEIVKNIREGGKLGLAATGQGYAPLHFFTSLPNECAFEVGLLIEQGVDVNATDVLGAADPRAHHYRALQLAVERGHQEVVRELLAAPGIDIEVSDEMGRTPLFVAFDNGSMGVVKMLLETGAMSVVPRPAGGAWDLLAKAVATGVPEIVHDLLKRGVPLSVHVSTTPLLVLAVRTFDLRAEKLERKVAHRAEIVELLLGAGADPHEEDEEGHTAMYNAALENSLEVVKLLETRRDLTVLEPLIPV